MAYEVVSVSIPDELVDCAAAIIRKELDDAGASYDIDIVPTADPEDPDEDAVVIWAHLRRPVSAEARMKLSAEIAKNLTEAKLSEEHLPLQFVVSPSWSTH